MRYKVKSEKKEEEGFVEFWLEQFEPGYPIELKARHSCWRKCESVHILSIYEDGHVKLSGGISGDLKLKLDNFGRIKMEEGI